MDYDRYDALLHYIFKQTQGDAWFRPDAAHIAAGVCLRDDEGEYRVFPYETIALEPFEQAVRAMGLMCAVKVRSAVAHAAMSQVCVFTLFYSHYYHFDRVECIGARLRGPLLPGGRQRQVAWATICHFWYAN
jgi:hypothetical protein